MDIHNEFFRIIVIASVREHRVAGSNPEAGILTLDCFAQRTMTKLDKEYKKVLVIRENKLC